MGAFYRYAMTLYVCINGYQDGHLLADCLRCIKSAVPDGKIVYVDGAYQRFVEQARILAATCFQNGRPDVANGYLEFAHPESTDNTWDVLKEFGVETIIRTPYRDKDGQPAPWPNEQVKRSSYFIGTEGDWYFVVDADERVIGRFPNLSDLQANGDWCIQLRRDEPGSNPYPVMRIHRHVDGMKFEGAHYALFKNDKIIRCKDLERNWVIKGCSIDHLWNHRGRATPLRHNVKGHYYQVMFQEENETRLRYEL